MEEVSESEIEKLLQHISKDDYLALVNDFFIEITVQLEAISESNYSTDRKGVIRTVHSIKGSSSSLGFNRLSRYSAEFEELLKNHSLEEKSDIFVSYLTSVQQSLIAIKQFFNDNDRRGV